MEKQGRRDIKSYKLIIKSFYFESLENIVNYIADEKKEPLNALKIGRGINNSMEKIIENPTSYSECENLPTKSKLYREARYKTWLIIFKLNKSEVTILGVLSGKQKPSSFRNLRKK